MVSEVVTYIDSVDGVEVTKKLYFNLTQAELSEISMDIDGGLEGLQNRVDDDFKGNFKEYYGIIKNIITKAYGVKSKDGRTLIKPEEETLKFIASEAYSVVLDKLFTDANETEGQSLVRFLEKVSEGARANNAKRNPVPAPEKTIEVSTV